MKRILFVAHRFGHPGGTEQTMYRYVNTAVQMGYEAAAYAPEIRINKDRFYSGTLDGVTVTNDINILYETWDMIVVHGDGSGQNQVHQNPRDVGGPIFYLLCRPEEQNQSVLQVMLAGMKKARWVGCATSTDYAFAEKYGYKDKIRPIRGYPIECPPNMVPNREKFGITENNVYISTGGFWPHKQFEQIAESFCRIKPAQTELILTGYDVRNGVPDYVGMGKAAGVKISSYFVYNKEAIYELMASSDLYIWNSKPGSEGFGLVLLESMYYNLPWIGTHTAAAIDLNGAGGQTYQTRDEMEQLMATGLPKPRPIQAENNRRFVEEYSTKNLLSLLFKVLDE